MSTGFSFDNNQLLQDMISGFTGIVTGRADYITGCRQYLLQPKCDSSNKKTDAEWFDEGRLTLTLKKKERVKVEVSAKETGGPQVNSAPIK